MYLPWARGPLDPDLLPFSCALTTALCSKPTLMEEFGGCTAPPGEPSQQWEWTAYGHVRTQFMAAEEALAAYVADVLPRLVSVGATGALLWCFADYAPELWDRPPCDEARHERHFGLVRPDGSLKPHVEAVRVFAATQPLVAPAPALVPVLDAEAYYAAPLTRLRALYEQWGV
jgi:endo-1,4-beta-mannosidase